MTGSGLLAGRVALVTGAARGLGFAIASRLAAAGAAVVLADVDGAGVADAAARLREDGAGPCLGVAMDVTDADSVEQGLSAAEDAFGLCDVVVANAGIVLIKPALEIGPAQFERVQRVNLLGSFTTATAAARRLAAAGRPGSIVLNSSLFGLRGAAGNAAYSASKFGMIGLTEALAADLAPHGIRVNAVCPGQIESEMMQEVFRGRAAQAGTTAEAEFARFLQRIPLGRLGSGQEVADSFLFLAGDLSRYITGQHIVVDGGWSLT